MIYLMNSAMMPNLDATYRVRSLTREEFVVRVREALRAGVLESRLGYKQNVDLVNRWLGDELVGEDRREAQVAPGDRMLVMRLKYRVANPALKGAPVDENDFEFAEVEVLP